MAWGALTSRNPNPILSFKGKRTHEVEFHDENCLDTCLAPLIATGCSAQWVNVTLAELSVLTQMALNHFGRSE
jgi:hypothetical protein